MRNARIQILFTADDKTGFLIKRNRINLRREPDIAPTALAANLHCFTQQSHTNTLAAPRRQHSHATYDASGQNSGASNGISCRVTSKQVQRFCIETIPLQLGRHMLLFDEYSSANRAQRFLLSIPGNFNETYQNTALCIDCTFSYSTVFD